MSNKFGNAESTNRGYGSAIEQFNKWQQSRDPPQAILSELPVESIENDHLYELIFDFARYLGSTRISKKWRKYYLFIKTRLSWKGPT